VSLILDRALGSGLAESGKPFRREVRHRLSSEVTDDYSRTARLCERAGDLSGETRGLGLLAEQAGVQMKDGLHLVSPERRISR
jgi:hypothetical protein